MIADRARNEGEKTVASIGNSRWGNINTDGGGSGNRDHVCTNPAGIEGRRERKMDKGKIGVSLKMKEKKTEVQPRGDLIPDHLHD